MMIIPIDEPAEEAEPEAEEGGEEDIPAPDAAGATDAPTAPGDCPGKQRPQSI